MKKKQKLETFISEVVDNIRSDRAMAATLLSELMLQIQQENAHKDMGLVASKYLETLQRSNEQLVKVASLLQKDQAPGDFSLTNDDKEKVFDIIKGNKT